MPKILELRKDIKEYVVEHRLGTKWEKAKMMFEQNPFHPSLHTELLEPKHRHIYSFRLDRKYRAVFIVHSADAVEVIAVTKHYRK